MDEPFIFIFDDVFFYLLNSLDITEVSITCIQWILILQNMFCQSSNAYNQLGLIDHFSKINTKAGYLALNHKQLLPCQNKW